MYDENDWECGVLQKLTGSGLQNFFINLLSGLKIGVFILCLTSLHAQDMRTLDIASDIMTGKNLTGSNLADFDGDGKDDLCRIVSDNSNSSELRVMLSTGKGFKSEEIIFQKTSDGDWAGKGQTRGWADFNGDGKADFCRLWQSGSRNYLRVTPSNGTGFETTDIISSKIDPGDLKSLQWVDFNGDGKVDNCRIIGNKLHVTLSTGTGFQTNEIISSDIDVGVNGSWVDFNGDDKADYCRIISGNKLRVTLSGGDSFVSNEITTTLNDNGGVTPSSKGMKPYLFSWADFNGDDKMDFCWIANTGLKSEVRVKLSTGTGFENGEIVEKRSDITFWAGYTDGTSGWRAWKDVDGDGMADFCRIYRKSRKQVNELLITFSTGEGLENKDVSIPLSEKTESFLLANVIDNPSADFCWLNRENKLKVKVLEPFVEDLTVNSGNLSYYHNYPLNVSNTEPVQAVVAIHGAARNPDIYYGNVARAGRMVDELPKTLIIAPWFRDCRNLPRDKRDECNDGNLPASYTDDFYWKNKNHWRMGYRSINKPGGVDRGTPSFQIMDEILRLINRNFPNVKFISVVGHSAGGQFVQRYSALSTQENALRPGGKVRYIAANPSSYMFITPARPEKVVGECDDYDEYRYGIEDLPGALGYTSLSKEAIRNNLLFRQVYLLLGKSDTSTEGNFDDSCEGNAQGRNRYERGKNYFQHIKCYNQNARHLKFEIEGVAHDARGMYISEKGRSAIFDAQYPQLRNNVKELRMAISGFTQENLAAQSKLTREKIAKLEEGTYEPTLQEARQVAKALGASIEEAFLNNEE